MDAAQLNFQLRDDSPACKLGFQRIPIEKIGLYQRRAGLVAGGRLAEPGR